MPGKNVRVRSSEGGEFDCYLATPRAGGKVPGVVLASAVHGVNADIRAIADEFASQGYIAAAPDLFWRSIPGPLPREDKRSSERAQPRLEVTGLLRDPLDDAIALIDFEHFERDRRRDRVARISKTVAERADLAAFIQQRLVHRLRHGERRHRHIG